MPALTKPALESFTHPSETSAPLDWAPLTIIDLSKFDTPGGKEQLAQDLKDPLTKWGFWVVTGYDLGEEEINRQLAIGNSFFKQSLEEKRKVACDFTVGSNFGYREPTRFIGNTDVKENMEVLNIPKYTEHYASVQRHDFINQFEDEIAPFHRKVWTNVVRKLLILFAIIFELPENYFVDRHDYDSPSMDHLRYMIYHPRSHEEDNKIGDQWLTGHTDFGSLTLLFSQRVAAYVFQIQPLQPTRSLIQTHHSLQVRTPDNEWKWIKHVNGGIICNAADTLSFLTKGYIKSAIHRVVRPPADQAHLERLGLFYFVRPGDSVPMAPAPSPVLIREGLLTEADLNPDPGEGQVTGAGK
ncbi:hypothetical protein C0989_010870 [Termitomyces sp. Mn162]|nr:hypothetical protein C0989_010870 [Termitomyces sp. Mn162]